MYISPHHLNSQKLLITTLARFFMKYKNPAIFCVGNSKIIGDAFAPMLGEYLLTHYQLPLHIYGRKDKNITSSTLPSYYEMAKKYHDGILVIDSAFCKGDEIGTLFVAPYGCVVDALHHPTKIGDFQLLGNINTHSFTQLTQLLTVKKEMVAHLVLFASEALSKAYQLANYYKKLI